MEWRQTAGSQAIHLPLSFSKPERCRKDCSLRKLSPGQQLQDGGQASLFPQAALRQLAF